MFPPVQAEPENLGCKDFIGQPRQSLLVPKSNLRLIIGMDPAAEMLERIKSLPVAEQTAFVEMFERWRTDCASASATEQFAPVDWSESIAQRKAIFGDAVLPNMVLEARKLERY